MTPELEELRQALARAESDYELAQYIDSTARMERERLAALRRIADLKEMIADAEAKENAHG